MAQAMLAAKMGAKKEIDMGKYSRMKKIGMTTNAIVNRMRLDGVSDDVIAEWGGAPKSSSDDNKEVERSIMEIRPANKMKPFHWAKFTQFQVENTVWNGVDKVITKYKINYEELEGLFQQFTPKPKTESQKKDKKKEEKESDENQLIDPRRSQNVMIGLSRIGLKEDEILDAILKMDDKKLPPEKVRKLIPYVPSDGELQMVREYVKNGGDVSKLSQVERFFAKMMDLVDIKSRLNLWLFKSDFPTVIENVKERIGMVQMCIDLLIKNQGLKDVFTIILAIGNYMNAGSSRGNAYGFHLEPTLNMLEGMKGIDKKTSLMMYVVQTVQKCKPDALKWVEELDILPQACKVQTNALQQDVDSIRRDMNEIEKSNKSQKRTLTRTHIDWARDGAAVPLNQIAAHFRVVSKTQPHELAMKEFSTYKTLRAPIKPGLGVAGKIGGPGGFSASGGGGHIRDPSGASVGSEDDLASEEVDKINHFGKLMLQFYKRANATVREVETLLKKTNQSTKKLCQFYGNDESTKWEDVFIIFNQFRDRFIKASRELGIIEQKKIRKEKISQQKDLLADKLKNRKNREDVVPNNPSIDIDDVNSSAKPGSNAGSNKKTKAMYAAYLKKKKEIDLQKEQGDKKDMWV